MSDFTPARIAGYILGVTDNPDHLDCDHCGRTSYWCHCDTHPVGPMPEAQAEAIAFLASIGLTPTGQRLVVEA